MSWVNQLAGRRVFITGATGCFGRSLLDRFLALPSEQRPHLVLLSRAPHVFQQRFCQYASLSMEWVAGDVASFPGVAGNLDYVLHLATDVKPAGASGSLKWFDSMVQGTRRVLELSLRAGASRVLLTSSGAVYGPQPTHTSHLEESWAGSVDSTDPGSSYSLGKRVTEHLGCLFHAEHGLPVTLARCFTFVGPHLPLDAHFAIGNFMRDALHGRAIEVRGDGTAMRSYMHTDDLVEWLLTILVCGTPGRAYNVGSDVAVSIADLAHRVARQAPHPVSVRVLKQPDPQAAAQRYVPSIARARGELGLDVTRNLDQAIAATLNWHCAQRNP